MRRVLIGLRDYWHELDERIDNISEGFKVVSRSEDNCVRIMSISGVGPMISTAMVAFDGKREASDRGRDFASWMGLMAQQFSTGGRPSSAGSPSGAAGILR